MMGSFWQDIRYAGRSLRRLPGFSAVIVLILALGIGANVAMFGIIDSALLHPVPFPEPDRLVLGRATVHGSPIPQVSAQDFWDYRDRSTSFESLDAALGQTDSYTITGVTEPERVDGTIVTTSLFRTLDAHPVLGRPFTADEGLQGAPNVAMISYGYWQRRLGGAPDAIGRTITVDGLPHTIVGVMPSGFHFLFDVDFWRPMRPDSGYAQARQWHNWFLVGRLRPGVSLDQAQADVDVISAQLESQYPDSNTGKALLLTDLREALVEDYRSGLLLLMSAVGLVLLIACGNVAGLLLARSSARRGELSLRSALGATGSRLLRQLLTESLVLAGIAGLVGILLARWLQDLLVQSVSVDPAAVSSGLSSPVLGFALGVTLATGLLFGIAPAVRASRGDPVEDLKSGARTADAGGTKFRSGLVIAQVATSIVLLICAGLLIRSFASLLGVDPGFRLSKLLTAEIGLPSGEYAEAEKRIQFYTNLQERLRAIPGVEDVALTDRLPIRDPGNWLTRYAEGAPPVDPADRHGSPFRVVMPGYFETMGIRLLAGRGIEATDVEGSPLVVVLSEELAEGLFPGKNPIGRQVFVDHGRFVPFEVVGVVSNVHLMSLQDPVREVIYSSYYQVPHYTMRMAVRTAGEPGSVVGAVREAVWSLDRNLPLAGIATMKEALARSVNRQEVLAVLLAGFAGVALLLAAIGLYGVLAYYVSQRQHEIGVRIALGAGRREVLGFVVRRGTALVGLGLVIGIAGALGATRLVAGMLYAITPTDPTTYVLVSLSFALVAVAASLIPAWRALHVDPVMLLHTE